MSRDSVKADQLEDLRAERDRLKAELAVERATVEAIKGSVSFQLGNMLVQAVASPGRNTLLLPYRLLGLCREGLRRRRRMQVELPARSELPRGKLTEVRLDDIRLDSTVAAIIKGYVERFGVDDNGRLGGSYDSDWKRVQYVSTLLPEAESVLDVGIGTGAFLNLLMSLDKFQRVLGLDIRKHSRFTTLFESQHYQIMYASVTALPFADRSVDVVTCMEVLEHLDRESVLAALPELRRVVKRLLIISVPYNEKEPLPRYHKLRFTDNDLLAYFPNGEFILLKKAGGTPWVVVLERL